MERKWKFVILALILVAIGVAGYLVFARDTTNGSSEDMAGWETYRNEKYGFEFRYPAALFTLQKNAGAPDDVILLESKDINYGHEVMEAPTGGRLILAGAFIKGNFFKYNGTVDKWRAERERFLFLENSTLSAKDINGRKIFVENTLRNAPMDGIPGLATFRCSYLFNDKTSSQIGLCFSSNTATATERYLPILDQILETVRW